MTITLNENGAITAVCTLSVEDYLLGVVPYEMSNSFPIEALKAPGRVRTHLRSVPCARG